MSFMDGRSGGSGKSSPPGLRISEFSRAESRPTWGLIMRVHAWLLRNGPSRGCQTVGESWEPKACPLASLSQLLLATEFTGRYQLRELGCISPGDVGCRPGAFWENCSSALTPYHTISQKSSYFHITGKAICGDAVNLWGCLSSDAMHCGNLEAPQVHLGKVLCCRRSPPADRPQWIPFYMQGNQDSQSW